MGAPDTHDNRATVTLDGKQYELIASKLAERIYGDRFRSDVDALGPSNSFSSKPEPLRDRDGNALLDDDGNVITHQVSYELTYVGRLKFDIMVSANSRISAAGEIPDQVVAAAWAMAKAAGSTEKDFDEWFVDWLSLPSNSQEDINLWEAVCVDLAERAFFRDYGRPGGPAEPDEDQEG